MADELRRGITLGVELEFLVYQPQGLSLDLWEFEPQTRMAVATLLKRAGLPTAVDYREEGICEKCDTEPRDQSMPSFTILSEHDHPFQGYPPNRCFFVQLEGLSANYLPAVEADAWHGAEIATPVFPKTELTAGLPRLRECISVLRGPGLKVMANDSCGLHVHAGYGRGMTLSRAKKVATLVMLLEDTLLLPLCAESRRDTVYGTRISWRSDAADRRLPGELLAALGKASPQLDAHCPASALPAPGILFGRPGQFHETLRILWGTRSLCQLARCLRSRSNKAGLALVIRTKDGQPWEEEDSSPGVFEGNPCTFEFRYSQMSFDVPHIKNWAEICCTILELAVLSAPQFKAKVVELTDAMTAAKEAHRDPWEQILTVIGLGHQIPQWREQKENFDAGLEIAHLDEDEILLPE